MDLLKNIPSNIISKAEKIKALFFDVDGVLTDGSIIYTNSGDEIKSFNVKDGQIIKHLKEAGIKVGAITGRSSDLVKRRCEELKLDFCVQGVSDKLAVVKEKMEDFGLQPDQVAYIGDDIIDLKVILEVGLGVAPANALDYVCDKADFVSSKDGGKGVLREVADMILAAQGKFDDIMKNCL
ncbi:KdsC family phosphatase [Fulvivirga lutea]|uniref:HAD-IIIA family hydrolase n=1 Tax=Fulvivirga lutea TaxID=2810512 RepID=A0A974WGS4_9BACT|nr:HAD-IIIA family hydrolase [Fulvivirga lutea]QSE96827.1 HAD-IIIA family hydrolase [Fulvivirga lutea]